MKRSPLFWIFRVEYIFFLEKQWPSCIAAMHTVSEIPTF